MSILTEHEAIAMAQEHYDWSVTEGMGLFMIAEAWGIKPWAVTQYGGHGVLTEGYVINEMAQQIMEMWRVKEEEEPTQGQQDRTLRVVSSNALDSERHMGDFSQRRAGLCKR